MFFEQNCRAQGTLLDEVAAWLMGYPTFYCSSLFTNLYLPSWLRYMQRNSDVAAPPSLYGMDDGKDDAALLPSAQEADSAHTLYDIRIVVI